MAAELKGRPGAASLTRSNEKDEAAGNTKNTDISPLYFVFPQNGMIFANI